MEDVGPEEPAMRASESSAWASSSAELDKTQIQKQDLAQWKRDARLPFRARVGRFLQRHSPFQWLRVNHFSSQMGNVDLDIDWKPALRALEAVVWPIFAIHLLQFTAMMFSKAAYAMAGAKSASAVLPAWFQAPVVGKLLIPYMTSPWTVHHVNEMMQPILEMQRRASSFTKKTRKRTLPEAWAAMSKAKELSIVYRTPNYDVFLPLSTATPTPIVAPTANSSAEEISTSTGAATSSGVNNTDISSTMPTSPMDTSAHGNCNVNPGKLAHLSYILLLPGSGIEHTAYAQPAKLFSDFGYVVVTVSGEPWRMVTPKMGYNARYLKSIMITVERDVTKKMLKDCTGRMELSQSLKEPETRWFLVGHSLGAFTGLEVAKGLGATAVAMWAAAPFNKFLPDWRSSACRTPSACIPPVVVVQGSKDVVMQTVGTPKAIQIFWQGLPDGTREYVIPNGTHKGFANYLSANLNFQELPPAGTDPKIAAKQQYDQQKQAVEITHQFFQEIIAKPKKQRKKKLN